MFKHFAFLAVLCVSVACSDGVRAQSYSAESLAGLKTFRVIIDLPANAARCGPVRRDLRDALVDVFKPSNARLVEMNRTADAIMELEVSVADNCDKTMHMSVLASVTIMKTSEVIFGLPIWDSGPIGFGQGSRFNGPSAVRFLGQKFLVAWNSVNQ